MKYIFQSLAAALIFLVVSNLLPQRLFFRPWEYMNTGYSAMPFRPTKEIEMVSQGDLIRLRNDTTRVKWFTDDLGFRNMSIEDSIDILILGDSYSVGSGLDQSDIISEVLKRRGHKAYVIAPYNPICGLLLFKKEFGYIPKTVIWEETERTLSRNYSLDCQEELQNKYWKRIVSFFTNRNLEGLLMSKLSPKKTSSLELMTNSGVIYALPKRYEQDLFDNSIPIVMENLREIENVIPEESDLIFIPVPDKLTMVDSTLYNAFSNFIEHINEYYECRKIFKTPMALEDLNSVYQKDDTHFNEGGIEKYARAILIDN